MKKIILPLVLLALLFSLCLGGFFFTKRLLHLPFRASNDSLHERHSTFTLDFLIPAGTYIDTRMTIGDVIRVRFKREKAFYERWTRSLLGLVPPRYWYLANLLLFSFWFFTFMAFFRVFTFMGYARAFRGSLLLGGLTYYFMPDFAPETWDDLLAVSFPVALILIRWAFFRPSKKRP